MGEVKGAARVMSPGQESERGGPSCRDDEDVGCKKTQTRKEKGENRHPHERQGTIGSHSPPEDSRKRPGYTRSSEEFECSRRKRKGPIGSISYQKEHGNLEKKMKGSSCPDRGQGRKCPPPTSGAHHSRGGSVHRNPRHRDRRPQPRSQSRTSSRGRSKPIPEAWHSSPQPRRHCLPEALMPPQLSPLCTFSTHTNALVEAVGELQAPGGAFLRVPAHGKEPTASQRAWLTLQLAHAGAALYGALMKVNSILAAQPWTPAMSQEPHPCSQGPVLHPRGNQTAPMTPCPPRDGSSLLWNGNLVS